MRATTGPRTELDTPTLEPRWLHIDGVHEVRRGVALRDPLPREMLDIPADYDPAEVLALIGKSKHYAIYVDEPAACWIDDAGGVQCAERAPPVDRDRTHVLPRLVTAVPFDGKAVALGTGCEVCAILEGGRVACVNSTEEGLPGLRRDPSADTWERRWIDYRDLDAVQVVAPAGPVREAWVCALTREGWVYCWGTRGSREAVPHGFYEMQRIPVGPAKALSGEDGHVCALHVGGLVQCWGRNDQGQLGNGRRTENYEDYDRPSIVLAPETP